MPRAKPPPDGPDMETVAGRPAAPRPEPGTVFDPDLFKDLRDMVGTARMRLALEELDSVLGQAFREAPTLDPDRDLTFQLAHRLAGRAGLMGFTALQNACVQLQQACATRAPFRAEYSRTCRVSLPTREAIAALLKQTK